METPDKKPKKTKAKMGRPKKEINWKQVEGMMQVLCTDREIELITGVSKETLARECKLKFGMTFEEFGAQKREGGKMSLRRKMHQRAINDGSDTMLIWLSKNQLGWSDKMEQQVTSTQKTEIKLTFKDMLGGKDASQAV